jgi:hypothetical protein
MSALLETLRTNGVSKFCWSGHRTIPKLPLVASEPFVLTWNDRASIVFAGGAFKQSTMLNMAFVVKREAMKPQTRIVYLVLAMMGGRLGAMATAASILEEAGQHAAIVAYLQEAAFGPALWLAYHCGLIFAHPTTTIGRLQCFSENDDSDIDATAGMIEDLASLNPHVPRSVWARLISSSMNAEAAELVGIVPDGCLKRDVFELSGIDPVSWPAK